MFLSPRHCRFTATKELQTWTAATALIQNPNLAPAIAEAGFLYSKAEVTTDVRACIFKLNGSAAAAAVAAAAAAAKTATVACSKLLFIDTTCSRVSWAYSNRSYRHRRRINNKAKCSLLLTLAQRAGGGDELRSVCPVSAMCLQAGGLWGACGHTFRVLNKAPRSTPGTMCLQIKPLFIWALY